MSEPLVLDRYRLLKPLGQGGFGAVWLAQDERLDRRVAVKRLPAGLDDPEARLRFEREARITSSLDHGHIVHVHDFGMSPEGEAVIVYQLVEGETLRARLARAGKLDLPTCLAWGTAIADALRVAHEAGVVHRDVKPENVLLRASGGPVLADFGLARSGEGFRTRTGVLTGTPAYMAPELWEGRDASPGSDQWAWAASLYEMACGSPWVATDDPRAARQLARRDPAADLAGLPGEAGARLVPVLERALSPDPGRRFASMAGFLDGLQGRVPAQATLALAGPGGEAATTRALDSLPLASGTQGLPPGPAGPVTRAIPGPARDAAAPVPPVRAVGTAAPVGRRLPVPAILAGLAVVLASAWRALAPGRSRDPEVPPPFVALSDPETPPVEVPEWRRQLDGFEPLMAGHRRPDGTLALHWGRGAWRLHLREMIPGMITDGFVDRLENLLRALVEAADQGAPVDAEGDLAIHLLEDFDQIERRLTDSFTADDLTFLQTPQTVAEVRSEAVAMDRDLTDRLLVRLGAPPPSRVPALGLGLRLRFLAVVEEAGDPGLARSAVERLSVPLPPRAPEAVRLDLFRVAVASAHVADRVWDVGKLDCTTRVALVEGISNLTRDGTVRDVRGIASGVELAALAATAALQTAFMCGTQGIEERVEGLVRELDAVLDRDPERVEAIVDKRLQIQDNAAVLWQPHPTWQPLRARAGDVVERAHRLWESRREAVGVSGP